MSNNFKLGDSVFVCKFKFYDTQLIGAINPISDLIEDFYRHHYWTFDFVITKMKVVERTIKERLDDNLGITSTIETVSFVGDTAKEWIENTNHHLHSFYSTGGRTTCYLIQDLIEEIHNHILYLEFCNSAKDKNTPPGVGYSFQFNYFKEMLNDILEQLNKLKIVVEQVPQASQGPSVVKYKITYPE